jgi:NAD-dependent deacetylase
MVKAQPNAGHLSIAELHEMGRVGSVITQNIDGLHQQSGLPAQAVIELHGNGRRVRCMSCGELSSLDDAHRRIQAGDPAPECGCGGYLKPDTISFGQAMPVQAVEEATRLSSACDVFIVVGSTLLVQPAALMPVYAKQNNAFLCIINLSETPCDNMCDVLIREKAGTTLVDIVTQVKAIDADR